MNHRFAEAVSALYPDLDMARDVSIQDDGAGPYVKHWNSAHPIPTDVEVDAAIVALDAKPPKTKLDKLGDFLAKAGLTVDDLKTLVK